MAITEMSLPIDIPWKRMGVSRDMIDLAPGAHFSETVAILHIGFLPRANRKSARVL